MTAMALPNVRLTPAAAGQLAASLGAADCLRLSIDEAFDHDLVVSLRHQGDIALEAENHTTRRCRERWSLTVDRTLKRY